MVCLAEPYGEEEEDEDEELLVVGDHRGSDEIERLESLHDAAGGAAPPPPTPTSEIEDPLKGVIDAALNSPAIFAQRLKVNFGEGKPARPRRPLPRLPAATIAITCSC